MEPTVPTPASGSATKNGISLQAYQAIRSAVAEEVAMNSHSYTATDRGAAVREGRGSSSSRGEGASAHGSILVS